MYALIAVFCSLNIGQVSNNTSVALDRVQCRATVKEHFTDVKSCRNRMKALYQNTTGIACVKAFDKSKFINFTK